MLRALFLSSVHQGFRNVYLACIIHTVVKGGITSLVVKELEPILRESYRL